MKLNCKVPAHTYLKCMRQKADKRATLESKFCNFNSTKESLLINVSSNSSIHFHIINVSGNSCFIHPFCMPKPCQHSFLYSCHYIIFVDGNKQNQIYIVCQHHYGQQLRQFADARDVYLIDVSLFSYFTWFSTLVYDLLRYSGSSIN